MKPILKSGWTMKPILQSGCLAYFDTIAYGLIKCKVLAVIGCVAKIEITATKGGYVRGDKTYSSTNFVYPRNAVKVRKYGTTVFPYQIKVG